MSLRYTGKLAYQVASRSISRDHQASKCARVQSAGGRRFSLETPNNYKAAQKLKLKQSEESIRSAMFFSCWAPA